MMPVLEPCTGARLAEVPSGTAAEIDANTPFGGVKQSGIGKDMGPEQLEHFLETKAVWIQL
jgi:acyl-CoA reductase-like NAD-dependent aldehyde dehydrogenase